ncbi:hypothetical protein EXIGLDRAFT_768676 [Exidia glandulosa HHB12029]|uniref:Uncharacterized protein n=1 Tax=Exidia glandulosa HHB12029 TaxID=1314781 RepID=A0A165I1A1_EXIGL|nr:hypothetical protein EXIGLDRAFT_768676 [Exidia glandulosa HHB12029]
MPTDDNTSQTAVSRYPKEMPAHWKGEFPAAHLYVRPLLEGTWKILCLIAWGTPTLELRWASVRAETEEEHTQYLDGISKRLQTTTLVASLLLASNAALLTTEPPLSGQIVNYTAHGPYICLWVSFGLLLGAVIVGSGIISLMATCTREFSHDACEMASDTPVMGNGRCIALKITPDEEDRGLVGRWSAGVAGRTIATLSPLAIDDDMKGSLRNVAFTLVVTICQYVTASLLPPNVSHLDVRSALEARDCVATTCQCTGIRTGLFCGDGAFNCKVGNVYQCGENGQISCDYGFRESCPDCTVVFCE